jgi:hypothetical protein
MESHEVMSVLYKYPVFRTGKKISFFFKKSFVAQSLYLGFLFTLLIIIASIIDKTLILEEKNIGLLEHPTIWTFIIIQIYVPILIKNSISKLFLFMQKNEVIDNKIDLSSYSLLFEKQTSRQMNFGRFSYAFLILIGLICFTWNTIQNQSPIRFLGFDFWDSSNHPYGYWITRVYKLYLWGFLFPTIVHIQMSILFVLKKLLVDAERDKFFVIKPYDLDEYAGAGTIIKIVINPIVPILLLCSLSVLGAFFIHGKIGVTPIMGITILSLLFLLIYLIPAIQLRKIIKSEKQRQLTEITEKQNKLYFSLVHGDKPQIEYDNLDSLNSFKDVIQQIKSISIWPHWKFILKIIGVINIPTILSISKNLLPIVTKIIQK